jgi:predicted membrane-bound spermidine synthase
MRNFAAALLTLAASAVAGCGPAAAAALSRVRSYLFADGLLHLSLEADSGIMHWQPAP